MLINLFFIVRGCYDNLFSDSMEKAFSLSIDISATGDQSVEDEIKTNMTSAVSALYTVKLL